MTPKATLDAQIERYRAMTGEERLKIALDLHEFACNASRRAFGSSFPMPMRPKWNANSGGELN